MAASFFIAAQTNRRQPVVYPLYGQLAGDGPRSTPMPRFYFHYQDGGRLRTDPEGVVLPDAEAAWYQAVRSAREIIIRDIDKGCLRPGQCVEIADEMGLPVNEVPLDEVAGVAF